MCRKFSSRLFFSLFVYYNYIVSIPLEKTNVKGKEKVMDVEKLQERAVELRRAYQREWRRKNKDKVRANNRRYWERKAQKAAQEERQVQ
jgi:hypothetical protein